jgi:phosphatidylserine/phosphatidylglycerophosphate/cardiolipin synthase-like enzyme
VKNTARDGRPNGGRLVEPIARWTEEIVQTGLVRRHRRRLERAGAAGALAPSGRAPWAVSARPPRDGNRVEVLVDGSAALPRMAAALRGATSSICIAGWELSPSFDLSRNGSGGVIRQLLAERAAAGVDVRVLLWAGAPLPLYRPWRRETRATRRGLATGTRVRVALDAHERPMHCHHEKLVIVDGRLAFVGGLDLTDSRGDRFDSPQHPPRDGIGWHDVAARLEGPIVADVAEHFAARWLEVTGDALPAAYQGGVPASRDGAPAPTGAAGTSTLQLVRTIPEGVYRSLAQGEFSVLEAYLRALRGAQRFVYLENQFLWSPEIAAALAELLRHPPSPDFRLVLLLPARADTGNDSTHARLRTLLAADGGHGRLVTATVGAAGDPRGDNARGVIYVHAKIGIVDDRWLTLGSSNLASRSLFNDTEVNIVTDDAALARDTRLRLWAEHLETTVAEIAEDPVAVIDGLWKPRMGRLAALPPAASPRNRLVGALQSVLLDG